MTQATAPAAQRKPQIRAVRVSREHLAATAEFIRAVWSPGATEEGVARARANDAERNPVEPGAEFPTFAVMMDDRVIAYVTTIPNRFWDGAREHAAHWIKGLMVLPEFRNGPVGYLVLKEATQNLDLAGSVAVAPAARRLFEALGYRDLGALSNHLLLLRPTRVFRKIDIGAVGLEGLPAWVPKLGRLAQRTGLVIPGGLMAAGALRAWSRIAQLRSAGVRAVPAGAAFDDAELDALWQQVRGELRAGSVRDAAYLQWRYGHERDVYGFVGVRERGALAGVAVVRRPREEGGDERLRGVRVATIADVLVRPSQPRVLRALLRAAAVRARQMGGDALLASASHPALEAALRGAGFVRLPGNLHFLVRDPGSARALPEALGEWWLTRGDGNSDETF